VPLTIALSWPTTACIRPALSTACGWSGSFRPLGTYSSAERSAIAASTRSPRMARIGRFVMAEAYDSRSARGERLGRNEARRARE
jgi:hypothetical protein